MASTGKSSKAKQTKLGALHFITKSTGDSSRRFGPCEVCGRDASEVFRSSVSRDYEHGNFKGRLHLGDLFGHAACLDGLVTDTDALRSALALAGEGR
jgi:hypothetical protein